MRVELLLWTCEGHIILIKQFRSDLNKNDHIASVYFQELAQCHFEELLRQSVRDHLTANREHRPDDAIKIKISMNGARMSRTTNLLILPLCLLRYEELPCH